ncbi:MAG: ATP-dependent helicase UvrD/PcrA, partial [Thermomicrobiales bacterium]|nr:ATP-dependent helicase UvrD/PcrA [Thermomicrobiales bacterium]
VDEFHDVSPEQYRLLRALIPPTVAGRQLLVVADPNQAIFGFRGADPAQMLHALRRDYRPVEYELAETHRSAGNIVRAAGRVIGANGGAGAGRPVLPDHHPIRVIRCVDDEDEARCLLALIGRARAAGYRYDEIAVLYRPHKRADRAEAALLAGGVPIRRVRPGRFFDEPAVQEALRYLELIAALHDDSFVPALNWPRVLVDELTMIHLRRLAAANGIGLGQLAYRDDLLAAHCTPLTRFAIEGFRETIAAELTPLAEEPVALIVERLLECLGRRRDPIPWADRAALRDTLDYLGRPLEPVVECLEAAKVAGRPFAVVAADDLDCTIGAAILRAVLHDYLGHPAPVHLGAASGAEAFTILLSGAPARGADVVIAPRVTRTVTFGVAAQAWRLGQMLLMRCERLGEERFVVYDLESGSNLPNSAELVEVGAQMVEGGRLTEKTFRRLVRPSGPAAIGRDAEELHGIGWIDVAEAPSPAEVLPEFFAFAGDAILAGHFVAGFDDLVMRRVARSCGLSPPDNPILDTCVLARRLLPDDAHDLASMGREFGATAAQTHRALPDATLNAQVLIGLIERLQREREIDALSELLPLVALGIRASGVGTEADNALLVRLGARAAALGHGGDCLRLYGDLGADDVASATAWLADANPGDVEDDAEWARICRRWRETVDDYCRGTGDHTLGAFLHYAALAKEVDYVPDPAGEGRVTMLSIHSAKGKEWPVVFVIGAEDDQFTFKDEEIEEGRRVFYVAMTRPKRRLVVLWAAHIAGRSKQPTRYLRDIPEELLEWR